MQNKNVLMLILVLIALALGIYFMIKPASEPIQTLPTEVMTEEVEETTTEEEPKELAANIVTVEVQNAGLTFVPNEIRVTEGDTVRVVFTNTFGMHDFVIDEFGVQSEVTQAGDSTTVEFIADQTGQFEYYCSIMDHREMGMVGTLVVEPAQE